MLGLYIHVPFCAKICDYCDFHAFSAPEWLQLEYLELISREMTVFAERHPGVFSRVETLYIGGGTPSVLSPERLARLFGIVAGAGVRMGALKEATMEFNPESCDAERISVALESGITRASLGLQTLSDDLLSRVGRRHDVATGRQALDLLLSQRGLRVNADLMFNLPGQGIDDMLADVEWLTDRPLGHVSFYGLKVDPTRRLGKRIAKGEESVDEDLYADMYLRGVEKLESRDFVRYETSNFARVGEESLHNLNYWRRGEYLAFGPSAHGYFGGVRFSAPEKYAPWREYVKGGCPDSALMLDRLSPEDEIAEIIQLSLRTKYGLPLEALKERGVAIAPQAIERWISRGYLEQAQGTIRLVGEGWLFMDTVVLDLYSNCVR
ncbi:MAG: radical SAM family heme chaperone HemW [Fibrobacter sp.]|uniref:radical SAM family heme chaperone HemW n=1 Tax=Fibrobacter sp. TaxID=35828 RepID=UPI0025BF716B|nr:radical SAM family heme chaperone HemW [Fibrobacter sp.]MBR4783879.1 radical SAM family heme chaperone HemW [Fibrobacter sp.]